jgi:hypothetical protein
MRLRPPAPRGARDISQGTLGASAFKDDLKIARYTLKALLHL